MAHMLHGMRDIFRRLRKEGFKSMFGELPEAQFKLAATERTHSSRSLRLEVQGSA